MLAVFCKKSERWWFSELGSAIVVFFCNLLIHGMTCDGISAGDGCYLLVREAIDNTPCIANIKKNVIVHTCLYY